MDGLLFNASKGKDVLLREIPVGIWMEIPEQWRSDSKVTTRTKIGKEKNEFRTTRSLHLDATENNPQKISSTT